MPGDGAAAAAAVSETASNSALFYNPFEDAAGAMDDDLDGSDNGGGGGGWDNGDGDIDDPGGESGRGRFWFCLFFQDLTFRFFVVLSLSPPLTTRHRHRHRSRSRSRPSCPLGFESPALK